MSRSIFFLQAEDGIRAGHVTGVQTCALPISKLKARPAGMLVLPGSHRFVGEDASETRRNEMTQGVLYIHSAPRALAPHIEWAASGVLGVPARIRWEEQHVGRGLLRAEMTWRGRDDTGPQLVSAMRGMHEVRFEVTQERSEEHTSE